MANIQASLKGWSTTEGSNQPDSTDSATIAGDLRAIQAGVRDIYSQNTIASAATTDLGSLDEGSLTVSGVVTITALGTVSAGIRKNVVFSGILTLTHNAASLILPGSANITTAANDRAEFESLGSGNWRCNWYTRASGVSVNGVSDGVKGDVTVSASGATWTLNSTAVTGKAAETAPAIDDLILLSDTSEAAALNKMTLSNLLNVVNVLTEDTSPDKNADYILTYDGSASAVKKVLLGRSGPVIGTATTASGTSVDFTGIPSWARRITITMTGLSTNGTSDILVQIGDSGGVEVAGYSGALARLAAAAIATVNSATAGFTVVNDVVAVDAFHGHVVLHLNDPANNTWEAGISISESNATSHFAGSGSKSLSAVLDRVRITTAGGVNTFDAGVINILYE